MIQGAQQAHEVQNSDVLMSFKEVHYGIYLYHFGAQPPLRTVQLGRLALYSVVTIFRNFLQIES